MSSSRFKTMEEKERKKYSPAATTMITKQQHVPPLSQQQQQLLLQRKIEAITDGMSSEFVSRLAEQSEDNALTVCNYILAMKTEINPSKQYRQNIIQALCYLSRFHGHKILFTKMTRDDVILYLDSLHKPEITDPQHRFIGTYNLRRIHLLRFFK